jgi:hypothetical protein
MPKANPYGLSSVGTPALSGLHLPVAWLDVGKEKW